MNVTVVIMILKFYKKDLERHVFLISYEKRSDTMKISKKKFWILAIAYTTVTFLLHNVLHTALGEFLMQLSYFALAFVVTTFAYRMIKFAIQELLYIRKKKKRSE